MTGAGQTENGKTSGSFREPRTAGADASVEAAGRPVSAESAQVAGHATDDSISDASPGSSQALQKGKPRAPKASPKPRKQQTRNPARVGGAAGNGEARNVGARSAGVQPSPEVEALQMSMAVLAARPQTEAVKQVMTTLQAELNAAQQAALQAQRPPKRSLQGAGPASANQPAAAVRTQGQAGDGWQGAEASETLPEQAPEADR